MLYLFIICIILLFLLIQRSNSESFMTTPKKELKTLARQSARYSLASEQDASPLISMMHINYGLGYFWTLKDIATVEDIQKYTDIKNVSEYEDKLLTIQDKAHKKIGTACPEFVGNVDLKLAKIAGNVM